MKKLKEKVEAAVDNSSESLEVSLLADGRSKQLKKDTSNYNYIFSQGNRASFFANRDSRESLLLTAGKNYEDEEGNKVELEVYEKIFDANRAGERMMYVDTRIANLNFAQAFGLLTNEQGLVNLAFDSVFSIPSLVDMDTLSIAEKYALGKTVANYAILIHAQGRYNLSYDFLNSVQSYFDEEIGKESIALGSISSNLGVVSQSKGNFTEAENYFNNALEILKKGGKSTSLSYAIALNNKALLYNEIGQYDEAKRAIDQAISIADGELRSKGRDNTSFKINKGLIFYSSGEYASAEKIFREVIELKKKRMAENQTDVANVKNYLAATLMAQGVTSEVPSLLGEALEIFRKKYSEEHPAYIKTSLNMGRYHLFVGSYSEAETLFLSINEKYKILFGENHPDYLSSLEDLAVVAWKQGNFETARSRFKQMLDSNLRLVEKYFGAMSEYEKGQYWAKVRPSLLKFYGFAVENGSSDPSLLTEMFNLHLKTKGILLSASSKVREQILASDNETLKKTYREWVESKENLLLYYSYSKAQLEELKIDLASTEAKANQLEKELSRMSSVFAQSNKLPTTTLAQVKSKLSANDAAVEIIGYPVFDLSSTEKKNYAFLIADLNAIHPELVLIEDGQDLDTKYAKAYLNMVKLKAADKITYDKFWKPVDSKLEGKSDIHLSLDGVYFQVNIGALQRPDGSFVSDAFDLHLYSSTRDLVKPKSTGFSSKKANFFGYPDFGSMGLLSALPGTKAEIDAVSQITKSKGFATTTHMQKEATEENFKKINSPSLLHIATHGF
ncbi:MAG: tetratricopeptide repeat protein, partial [Bacteroidota bacterium]